MDRVNSKIAGLVLMLDELSEETELIHEDDFSPTLLNVIRYVERITDTNLPTNVTTVNDTLKKQGFPYRFEYIIVNRNNGEGGFTVVKDTNTFMETDKSLYRGNLTKMISYHVDFGVMSESELARFCKAFTIMYDIMYDGWVNHPSKKAYDIEDIDLLMYHRRLPFKVFKEDDGYCIRSVNW